MKKVINVLLGIIIFCAILVASVLMVGRKFLSPNNMSALMDIVAKEQGGYDNFVDAIYDGTDSEISKYVDEDKLQKALSKYLSSYFKVQAGVLDKTDSKDLEKLLDDAVEEYNMKGDKKIDEKEVKEAIKSLDSELSKSDFANKDVKKILEVVYSKILYICIGVVILCLVLIYLVCKRIDKVLFHLGLTSLINGIIIKFAGGALGRLLEEEISDTPDLFNKNVLGLISKVGITAMVVGVVCIVASIIVKKALDSKGQTAEEPELTETSSEPVHELPEETSTEESSIEEEAKEEEPTTEDKDL